MPPHDPPIELPLDNRQINAFVPPRRLFCPRPIVPLPIRVTSTGTRYYPLQFVVDTGADVTMIPEVAARRLGIVGYDPAAPVVATGTSFHGTLRGRWGHIDARIGSRPLTLPCFFFAEVLPRSGWLGVWEKMFGRRADGGEFGPFVLGRAGLFPLVSLLIERGRVALSDQPFR